MGSMTSIQVTFFEECEELLEALSSGLSQMQSGHGDTETMNAVFRAVHSIKGGAGAFGLADLVAFAHRFETVLDGGRSGRIQPDADAYRVWLRAADHLADLVAAAQAGQSVAQEATAGLIEALDDFLTADEGAGSAEQEFEFLALPLDFSLIGAEADPQGQRWHITMHPMAEMFANGHEPAWIIKSLASLGELEVRLLVPSGLEWRQIDLSRPVMSWDMRLVTEVPESDILRVFEFVEGSCRYTLEHEVLPTGLATATVIGPMPDSPLLRRVEGPPDRPAPAPVDAGVLPALAGIAGRSRPEDDGNSPEKAAAPALGRHSEQPAPSQTLRVDLDRVDRLINAVGELITNHAAIAQKIDELALPTGAEVKTHVEDYRMLARDIQEAVMAIRAQPVKPLFQRMARIVREAADATGKPAQLITFGENVEVDKTVIERLADPLTHMIRNAVDHGLESPETRHSAGKPPQGTITLSASHRSGRVVIALRDDGGGLNRPKILEAARRKGLVAQDADLTEQEIDALLFLPGFSTASAVSNLSGRGVGLDVVRTAVAALGGRISISSTPGQGTEFLLSVPLTLAVMDGMVVTVASQTMVVPIASILETIRPEEVELNSIGTDRTLLAIRGRFIPVIDVADRLGLVGTRPSGMMPLLLLVEAEDQSHYALAVDDVQDQRQVVIKGLDANYGAISGVSAATVLGNGQIALILDTDAIASGRGLSAARVRTQSLNSEGRNLGSQ